MAIDVKLGTPIIAFMSPDELIAYFGGVTETARALGVKPPSVSEWKASGEVPETRQYQAQIATGGALQADKPALREHSSESPERMRT